MGEVDQVGGGRAGVAGHLDQPHGVRRVLRPDHDHQVAGRGDLFDDLLPVLRRVADVVARRTAHQRESLPQQVHRFQRLIDAQRGLGQPDHLGRILDLDGCDVSAAVHDLDGVRRLAVGALHLLVPAVTDEHDVVALVGEPHRFLVHLGDQRAGGVDHPQVAVLRLGVDRWRHPVRGEHHQRTFGHLIRLVDEDRAPLLQGGHHMLVVHDLLAHVDRCAVLLEGSLDGHHRPVDTGAVAAGRCQQHTADGLGHPTMVGAVRRPGAASGYRQ